MKKIGMILVCGLFISIRSVSTTHAMSHDVLAQIFTKSTRDLNNVGRLKRYLDLMRVCVEWKQIIMTGLSDKLMVCTQNDKNTFLFRAVTLSTSQETIISLLQAGANLHSYVETSGYIPFYSCPATFPERYSHGTKTSPWFWAVVLEKTHFLSCFIQAGADIDAKESGTGQTALMKASGYGYTGLVELLLRHGADPKVSCRNSKTAYDYAKTDGVKQLFDMYAERAGKDSSFESSEDSTAVDDAQLYREYRDDSLESIEDEVIFHEVRDYI